MGRVRRETGLWISKQSDLASDIKRVKAGEFQDGLAWRIGKLRLSVARHVVKLTQVNLRTCQRGLGPSFFFVNSPKISEMGIVLLTWKTLVFRAALHII